MDPLPGVGFERKIAYSFIGLIAGDAVMLLAYSLLTQAWQQAPGHAPAHPLDAFPLYITCSLFSWVAVGLPAALLTNTDFVAEMKSLRLFLSAILLALAALVIIFIIYGRLPVTGLNGFFYCWGMASLVSCIASFLYAALLRQAAEAQRLKNAQQAVVPVAKQPEFRLEDYIRKPDDDTKSS